LPDHFGFSDRILASDLLHVHAWRTSGYFSKTALRAGEYNRIPIENINRSTLAGHCHYLAKVDLSALRNAMKSETRA
jgi:hypothetical protein